MLKISMLLPGGAGRLASARLSISSLLEYPKLISLIPASGTVPTSSWGAWQGKTFSSSAVPVTEGSDTGKASFEETRQAWIPGVVDTPPADEPARCSSGACASTGGGCGRSDRATPEQTFRAVGADNTISPGRKPADGGGPLSAEMEDVFATLEDMGLQPGRNCVVGDGLAVVDVGLYLQGVKVAIQMEEARPSLTLMSDPKAYALKRAMRSMMQAHGWHMVTLAASDWRRLDADQKPQYIAHCINTELGGNQSHGHHHHHGGSCGSGCSDPSHKH